MGRPPRSLTGQPWYTLAVLTLANVCGLVDRQVIALLVEPIKRDLQISDTQVSLLMGLSFVLFYSVLGVPVGALVDRYSRRRIVAAGALLWSGMTVLCGFAQSFGQLLVLRMGVGVGEATLGPSAVSLLGDVFPRESRARAMSVFALGTFLGSGIAYAIGAYVAGVSAEGMTVSLPFFGPIRSWQVVFLVVGAPGLVVGALALTMHEPQRGARAAAASPREVFDYVRIHRRTLATLAFGFACSSAVNYGIAAWLATFFVRTHAWTATEAGALQGLLTMTFGVLGALAGGWLTDRWVYSGRADAPLLVAIIAAFGMIVTAGAYPLVSSSVVAAWLLVPVNIFAAMPWGAANAAVAEALPTHLRGQGTALYLLVVNLFAGVVGPTSVAVITDRVFANPSAVRYSLAICTVCGMVAVIAILGSGRSAYRHTVAARLS
ncbi:L-galactonate transporter [Luteitalea pratensis]|uniref:L-galactonate transporter n=1 Tax=Luteitalea pratensis TaxID=1855912 RepID=A0A143PI82_LUTPR|nr:MFS transporter [Luteitalea pratensis]AMY07808.1 L-galactonate transporter [Luteitalea pratensis]